MTPRQACAAVISLFRRTALDREFDEEARSHLDLAAEDFVRRGMSEADARRLARMKFGAVEASKDAHRDSRGLPWLEGLVYDLRFALRGLRRDRAFTVTAITMLTMAIGVNVTVFTVMDAMLFRGYPLVKRNERLVYLQERGPLRDHYMSYADFEDWRAQAQAFEGMAFVGERSIALRDGKGRSIDILAFTLSANTFGLLGVQPMLGRDFAPADEAPGAAPVAILNYRFWNSRFGKRADIVGLRVQINGAPATIIGVMPERFDFPTQENLWMPAVRTPELLQRDVTGGGYLAIGRLRDGARLQEARAELEAINRRLEADYPATNRGVLATDMTHAGMNSGPDAPIIWGSLWAGAWFVWLIACANVANLSLVRTIGRWRELSTRIALGAGRGRMVRQMFLESLILAGVAGALGWWMTDWSVRTWAAATASIYQVLDYRVDAGTLVYLVAISAAATILFSLAPIGRVVQLGVGGALKGDVRGVTQGLRGKHLQAGLVAVQMALAIVLLSGTGILVRSLLKIVDAETGVRDPEHVLVGSVTLPSDTYASPAARVAYFDRLDTQLRMLPGIEDASVASSIPVSGMFSWPIELEGRPSRSGGESSAQFMWIESGYFRALGVSATSGRDFNDGDDASALRVAMVNQSFAARFWSGEQPLGKRFHFLVAKNQPGGAWYTVVGIAPNIMQGDGTRQQFKPVIYLPFRQQRTPTRQAFFLARTAGPPNDVAQAVRAEVQKLDPDLVLDDFGTLKASFAFDRDHMDPEHSELGKNAEVALVFALIALLLAAIGLYAVIAHSVSQRTKEIGVRIALGAAAHDIRRLIFGEGMRPVALGSIAGLTVSLAVNRILQSQLVGVSPDDPVTMTIAPAVLILVALLACQLPSRRALRVDPAVALRHE
jgi:putative ABC transport system permease protein